MAMPSALPAGLGRKIKTADLTPHQTRLLRSLVTGWIDTLSKSGGRAIPPGTDEERFRITCRMIDGGYADVLYREDGSYGFNTSPDRLRAFARGEAANAGAAKPPPDPFTDRGPWYAGLVREVLLHPDNSTEVPDGNPGGPPAVADIDKAVKYVIHPAALDLAGELVAARFSLLPPSPLTWAEWIGISPTGDIAYVGMLVTDDGAGQASGHILIGPGNDPHISAVGFKTDNGALDVLGLSDDQRLIDAMRRIVDLAAATFELIRHPRAVAKEHREATTKLVRARGRLVRTAVPAFTDVKIHVTRDAADDDADPGDHTPGALGIKKRFHHVRPFAGVVRGKPQLVVGHWRGDPKLGVCVPRSYAVVP